MRPCALLLAFAALLSVPSARADELKLKDGTKIVGTIVGFEENSFRVKTSYGFAVVQKDQVVSISIATTAETAAPERTPVPAPAAAIPTPPPPAKTQPVAPKKDPAVGAQTPALAKPVAKTEPPAALASSQAPSSVALPNKSASSAVAAAPPEKKNPFASSAGAPGKTPDKTNAAALPAAASPARTNPVTAPVPVASAAAAPPSSPAAPPPMREKVIGNTYTNETYGFQMYKPPDWDVIQGARAILPGAITAMGTDDQSTYLLIGLEPAGKSLAAEKNATQNRLAEIMDNFRPLGEERLTVSGIPATEDRFRGNVDQHDWSGVVVFVPRGARLYTIFGMTIADTDLVQIQENVIARAIASLEFTSP